MLFGLVVTFILALTPIGELRLAIPIGLLRYHLHPQVVLLVAVLGNILPVFGLFWFFDFIEKKLRTAIESALPLTPEQRIKMVEILIKDPQKLKRQLTSKALLFLASIYIFLLRRAYRQYNKYQKQAAFVGLALFVAIPLPMTGAWSGAALAYLLGVKKPLALAAIFCGIFMAGIIVTVLTLKVSTI